VGSSTLLPNTVMDPQWKMSEAARSRRRPRCRTRRG
jgi:hypothetical protein